MGRIALRIDGVDVEVEQGTTLLQAARQIDVEIPALCEHPELPATGFCRICLVEVAGYDQPQPACLLQVSPNMEVQTHSPRVVSARRTTLELFMARCGGTTGQGHLKGDSRLQQLAHLYGVRETPFAKPRPLEKDGKNPAIFHDPNQCILCGLCVSACGTMQETYAINFEYRGYDRLVQPPFGQSLNDSVCTSCGQCVLACPTGAFLEQDHVNDTLGLFRDRGKYLVAILNPAVGVSIGESCGLEPGTDLTGALITTLRQAGFDAVLDGGLGWDLETFEMAFELEKRLNDRAHLPLIISSCPALVRYMEHYFPDLLPHLSVTKSGWQMLGTLAKHYLAAQTDRQPEEVAVVLVTPCTAAKAEATRPELVSDRVTGIDLVLTTREVNRLIQLSAGPRLPGRPPGNFDQLLGSSSGAGRVCETTGGAAEALLRTWWELHTSGELEDPVFTQLRGLEDSREVEIDSGEHPLRVAVAHKIGAAKTVLERIREGRSHYDLVELMGCPGGCVGGGGQVPALDKTTKIKRRDALYQADEQAAVRKPRLLTSLNQLYSDFLVEPLGEKSRDLLHTTFKERSPY